MSNVTTFTSIFVRVSYGNDTQAMLTGIQYVAPIVLVKTQTRLWMMNWSKTRAQFLQSSPGPYTCRGSYHPFQTSSSKFIATLEVQTRLSKSTDHDHPLFFHSPQAHSQALTPLESPASFTTSCYRHSPLNLLGICRDLLETCLEIELHLSDVSKNKIPLEHVCVFSVCSCHGCPYKAWLMHRCDLTSNAASRSLSRIHTDDARATFWTIF